MKKIIIFVIILLIVGAGGYLLFSDLDFVLQEEQQEEEKEEEKEEKITWETNPSETYLDIIEKIEKTETTKDYLYIVENYGSEIMENSVNQFRRFTEGLSSFEDELYLSVFKENIPLKEEIEDIEEEIEGIIARLKITLTDESTIEARMRLENGEWKLATDLL